MEVYLGEEYCGTSRGKNVCTALDNRFVICPDENVLSLFLCFFLGFAIVIVSRENIKNVPVSIEC
jgi:hypothetical protein